MLNFEQDYDDNEDLPLFWVKRKEEEKIGCLDFIFRKNEISANCIGFGSKLVAILIPTLYNGHIFCCAMKGF